MKSTINNYLENKNILNDIKTLIENSKNQVARNVNTIMLHTYWNIGKRIVEEEQNGSNKAEYGTGLLKMLSQELSKEYGKGFSRAKTL